MSQSAHHNQKGFSLVEIIVVMAILGVMSAGMAQYMLHMQRSQYMLGAKNSVNVFANSLQNILNIPQICSQAFNPGTQAFNLVQSQGTLGATPGQAIQLRLPGGTVSVASGYRESQFILQRLYILSDPGSTNIAPVGGNPNYLVKVVGNFDIPNPADFQSALSSPRITLAHLIIELDPAGSILACRTSVSQNEQLSAVCQSIGGTFANGNCSLPTPAPVVAAPTPSPAQQVQMICQALGGTYSGGNCILPPSGTTTSSSTLPGPSPAPAPTPPPPSNTVTSAQLTIICSSMGGTFSGGNCSLPGATGATGAAGTTYPPNLVGCASTPPACGQCKFAACTPSGWACTWDFRGGCMGYWEDEF